MGKKGNQPKRVKVDRYADKSAAAQQERQALDERWARRPVLPPVPQDVPDQAGES